MRDETYFRQFVVPRASGQAYEALGRATIGEEGPAGLRLHVGAATVEVTALAADLLRVGLFADGRPVEYRSEAVVKSDWPASGGTVVTRDGAVHIATSAARAVVRLDPLRIHFEDAAGRRFAEDDPELGMGTLPLLPSGSRLVDPLGPPTRVYKRRPPTEHYFGCGERTGGLDKTDSHQVFWNSDPPNEHTASLNNLYISIPFVLALDRGAAWGLFLDNPGRVEFDLARERADRSWFGADCGALVYYVFAGPTPAAVLDRYTELTGRTPLPPLWALGNHQSRWGYKTADQVRAIAREFRSRDIPCDALYLDIDYMDGYRVFTWDRERFPDPAGLIADLREQGFRVVTIVDPGVKVDEGYAVYRAGREADLYCKTSLGAEYHNVVWPGTCAFPDFTNPRARAWWGEQHRALLDAGVAGIWCDMDEPTMFIPTPATMPPDVVQPGDDTPRLHAQVHNLYGSQMARATREGLARLRPERRPFVITRAGYAGVQRDALHWTGDNSSWWEQVAMSMPQLQNLGLSGLAWVGTDIGGYAGDANGELLTRWVELGIFQPFCRNHSAWNARPQEPWAFGEPYETHIRRLLQLRQRLLPYLYSLFEECHRSGAPILRPLLFAYPDDETTYHADDEFLVGDALLVAPIARPGIAHRAAYLPRGTWFHYWSGERIDGPAHVLAHAPLGQPAIYVRANHPVPLWPTMRYCGERPPDPLTLLLFPAEGESAWTLYEDAGEGYEHERGAYARTRITCAERDATITVDLAEREGGYAPPREHVELAVRGLGGAPRAVRVNGAPTAGWRWADDTAWITLPATVAAQRVELDRAAGRSA
ncbi:MAG TPA: TIM-barrel domain-containing protein [Chloroflexota bacterium]|nr:TIM-barrel domain-containing protein [Chloroflexota bacterium]